MLSPTWQGVFLTLSSPALRGSGRFPFSALFGLICNSAVLGERLAAQLLELRFKDLALDVASENLRLWRNRRSLVGF